LVCESGEHVNPLDRLEQLAQRLTTYSWWQVAIEFAVIWVVVFIVVRFVISARVARPVKVVFFLLVVASMLVRVLGHGESFMRLAFLYDAMLPLVAIGLVVVFQPEIRRAISRIGDTPLFRRKPQPVTITVDAVVEAAVYLSRAKFGALMVIERSTPLKNLLEGGTVLNADISSRLLQTMFFPGTALHDLAVVIRGQRILAAGVQLPLAEPSEMSDGQLGSRHRAGVGVTQETDALVVIVSEETGIISLAERGELTRSLNADELRGLLLLKLNRGLVTALTNAPVDESAEVQNGGQSGLSDGRRAEDSDHRDDRSDLSTSSTDLDLGATRTPEMDDRGRADEPEQRVGR
jgi:diadenylate cyclase